MLRAKSSSPLLLIGLLCACADGAKENRPASEVQITASHYLFGLRAVPGFAAVPPKTSEVLPDQGIINLFGTSTYTVRRGNNTSNPDRYQLEKNGRLFLEIGGSSRSAPDVFSGAYSLLGDRGDLFFVDRSSTTSSRSLGLYVGTKILEGAAGSVDLQGSWHLLALHTSFANAPVPTPDRIARGVRGTIVAAADGTLTASGGNGVTEARVPTTLGGSVAHLGSGSATVNTNLTLNVGGDARAFEAAVGKDVIYAVDDTAGNTAGLALLARAIDTATPATAAQVAGEYLVGALTFFVNPAPNGSGTDGAVGRLTLTAQGAFRFDMVGSRNIDFRYTGSYTVAPDGWLTLTVDVTGETWHGAVTRDFNAVMVLDDFVEQNRTTPELNLFLALREKATV